MTKALIVASVAVLVEDGLLKWVTTLPEVVPEFASKTTLVELEQLKHEANIIDLLAHRLGVTQRNMYRMQSHNKLLMDPGQTTRVLSALQPIKAFRSTMTYNNWPYGLASRILEDLTGESIGSFCKKYLFNPLGLKRTTLGVPPSSNYVKSYMALTNATPFEVPPPPFDDGKLLAASSACKTTINDLMTLYGSLLRAASHQLQTNATSTPGSPFRRISDMWQSHISINEESSYGLGWVLTNLPAKGGLVGINAYEADSMPVIAKGTAEGTRMIYHQGSANGALSAVYLLPQSQTAVVVLSNSLDLCDTPDWVAQLIIESILECPEPNDFVALARNTSANAISRMPALNKQLADERILNTFTRSLHDYTGRYFNSLANFVLDIIIYEGRLRLIVQEFAEVYYDLYHYNFDVFAWNGDRDAETRKAMFPMSVIGFHKIAFENNNCNVITRLRWAYDKNIPQGETFYREEISRREKI